jgi:zinc/manganese transport system permease protein
MVIECVDPELKGAVSRAGGPRHLRIPRGAQLVMDPQPAILLAGGHVDDGGGDWPFQARDITLMMLIATASGLLAGYAGLLVSFHFGVASGPAIILVAGVLYLTSLLFGHVGGLVRQLFPGRHLEA